MKRITLLLMLLLGVLFITSCEKQPADNEWKRLYGYTVGDIAGTYSFSNITDAFEGLTEGKYSHICKDAQITVTSTSGSTVRFRVNCPSESFNRLFEGKPRVTEDDFLVNMKAPASSVHPSHELTAYVYENEEGEIRLHGFARHILYDAVYNPETEQYDYTVKSKTNYYFDVIKN